MRALLFCFSFCCRPDCALFSGSPSGPYFHFSGNMVDRGGEWRYFHHMNVQEMAKKLHALGNPTRLAVFLRLVRAGRDGVPVGGVQKALGLPGSTLTHHLQRLIAAGLAFQERHGTVLICKADFEAMEDIIITLNKECCADEGQCLVDDEAGWRGTA